VADTRRIPSSSVGTDPQRTGVRLGSVPPCVLGLLGSRPRHECLQSLTDSCRLWLFKTASRPLFIMLATHTAEALGIIIPRSILLRADEVIE
jgi:hypothetical protein